MGSYAAQKEVHDDLAPADRPIIDGDGVNPPMARFRDAAHLNRYADAEGIMVDSVPGHLLTEGFAGMTGARLAPVLSPTQFGNVR